MKIINSILVAVFFGALLNSCQKEKLGVNFEQNNLISVSAKGFLIFENTHSLIQFTKEVIENKNSAFLDDLKLRGFKAKGSVKNSSANLTNSVYDAIFNEDGFLQINDVILKLSNDEKFLYTVKEEFADADTYNKLMVEIYDALKMNKINVDRDLSSDFDFEAFIEQNPNGQYEDLFSGTEKRPMFGTYDEPVYITDPPFYNVYGQCEVCTHTYTQTTTYIFWIGFPHQPQYQSTNCVPGTGC